MDEKIRLKYERNLNHTYLVYEGIFEADAYVVQMILQNSIEGVLKCRIDKVDGRGRLYYEISSKQSLTSIFEKKKISYAILRQLLESFKNILVRLEDYLLPEEYLMTEPDYIYMEPEQKAFYFCIVPSDMEQNTMQPLLEFLLEHVDYTDEKAVATAYEWYKRAGEENYSFMDIYRQVFVDKVGNGSRSERKETIYSETDTDIQDKEIDREQENKRTEEPLHMLFDGEKGESDTDNQIANQHRKWYFAAGAGVVLVVVAIVCAIYIGVKEAAAVCVILAAAGVMLYRRYLEKEEESYVWEDELFEEVHTADNGEQIEIHDMYEEKEVEKQSTAEQVMEVSEDKEYGETVFITNASMKNGHVLKPVGMEFPQLGINFFPYIIGKLAGAVDGVVEHETVSRIHCKLEFENERYYIRDLNSTNGTIVNGTVVETEERMEIQYGDQIQIGQALYVFE